MTAEGSMRQPSAEMIASARRLRPRATDISVLGEGQLSVAVRVDDLVLRFPRSEFAREHLLSEIEVLELIESSDHATPEVVAVELDEPFADAYLAHRLLPGSPLDATRIESLSEDELAAVAGAVASFLRHLHAIDAAGVRLPRMSAAGFAATLRQETEDLLFDRMTEAGRGRALSELAALAGLPDRPPVLCHTDIGGGVLYDEEAGNVSFIDFGSAMITDPVLDVASLSVLGEDFMTKCAEGYPLLAERAADAMVVRTTFHLQDALYGARQRDWSYVDDILASYGSWGGA